MEPRIRVVHKIEDDVRFKDCTNPAFLLGSKRGGFLSLGSVYNSSRYQGSYFLKQMNAGEWSLFKVIEDICINKQPSHLVNNFYNIERRYDSTLERFFLANDSFFYGIENFNGSVDIILDCREMFDFDDKGRIYTIKKQDDFLVVEYTKYKDNKLSEEQYKIFLVIKGCLKYKAMNKWLLKEYEYDKSRGTKPQKLYVYHALRIPVKNKLNLVFAYSDNLEKAKEDACEMDLNYKQELFKREEYFKTICKVPKDIRNAILKLAYKNCIKSLDELNVEFKGNYGGNYGIFAGYPWFAQFWSRDEALAIIGMMDEDNFLDVKKILFKQLELIGENGRIPSRIPYTNLESADSIGWLFKRIHDFLNILKHKKQFEQYISFNDLVFIKDSLRKSIVKLLKYFTVNGLTYNRALETWMDTSCRDDTREGFRIEIQALRLGMYKFMKELCRMTKDREKYREYEKLERDVRKLVKENFWKPPLLKDGKSDETIRPNIFIAYYVYPELLTKEEWEKCFDYALHKLWLEWGGIATIDPDNELFCDEYSGENNRSYHRGDSWFWLNNLAGICLLRLNGKKYKQKIEAILKASCEEILYKGFIGHHAELSSAKELRAEGCLCQSWSAAMFIELVDEAYFE